MTTGIHLVVIHHGLWGAPEHTAYLATTLAEYHNGVLSPNTSKHIDPPPTFVVLNSTTNRDDHTYDGIDWCAERLVKEVSGFLIPFPS